MLKFKHVLVPLIGRFLRVGTISLDIPGLPEIVLISVALCLIDARMPSGLEAARAKSGL